MQGAALIDQLQARSIHLLATVGGGGSGSLHIFAALVLLSILALASTSRSFYRFQRNRLVARYMSGGWFAVLIGFLLGPWGMNVVTDKMLFEVRPALMFGLGWIGAIIGLQARRTLVQAVPPVVRRWVIYDTLLAAVLVGAIAIGVLGQVMIETSLAWWIVPVGLLITAGVGWAAETRSLGEERAPAAMHLSVLIQAGAGLAAIVAVMIHGLLMIFPARLADGSVGFSFTMGIRRLLAASMLAAAVGFVGRYLMQQAGRERRELFVVYIAMIAIISGIASELGVPPLFAAMLCGIVITNLGGPKLCEFDRFVLRGEQPVAILFALLAGVLIDPRLGLWGWVLIASLTAVRLLVKVPLMRWSLGGYQPALPAISPLYRAPLRQSLVAMALGVAVVLDESSVMNQQLLSVVLVVGALSELLPFLLSWIRRRHHPQRTHQPARNQGAVA